MQTHTPIKQLKSDFTTSDSSGSYDRIRAEIIRKKDAERLTDSKIWKEVSQLIKGKTDQLENVLDIGCGTGRYFDSVYAKNLYGLDGSYAMLERARYHWGSANTNRYERWATSDWAASSDWAPQTPWPLSFPPPSEEVAARLTTNYDKLTLIQDDVMDFCHREEYRNKFDFIYSVAMLGLTTIRLNPYQLIPLLLNLAKNNAQILLHINLSGLCRPEVAGDLDRERSKIESLLRSMKVDFSLRTSSISLKEETLKKYKISNEGNDFLVILTSPN